MAQETLCGVSAEDCLILVDYADRQTGTAGKLEAHQKGLLHRAFSVFLYNGERLLIQRRAADKYHSGGLWANTCCSHPRNGENLPEAVRRRLRQEAGVNADFPLTELGWFVYRADFGVLSEYELDHVFVGEYSGPVTPDPAEADAMEWVDMTVLAEEMRQNPQNYAAWFLTAFPMVWNYLKNGPQNPRQI